MKRDDLRKRNIHV